jgi:UDP-N-acetylmuramate--alanine ligase
MIENKTARQRKKNYKKYHFIGIGGMGMGNLALLMLAKGFKVSGSDIKESELTRQLKLKGARVFIGHDTSNLEDVDCVVYSTAVTHTNPEMFHAVSQHIPILRRAELLAELVNKEVGITVAGAHGKTTTSSMASLLLIKAGLKPTTAIGGIIHQGDYNATLGIGRHMVAEVDESDGSFLYFSPHFSIITNIDFEHVDYYHTWDKIKEAYAMFVQRTVPGGIVIACGDDKILLEIVQQSGRRAVTYGFSQDNDWVARNIHCDCHGSSYDCYHRGKFVGRFGLTVPGKHNVINSLSVVILGHELKIDPAVIADTLLSFSGVKRRFENKGEVDGVLVIDDYAHHPTEIAATLQTAKTLDRQRLITVFQPHRYTRTKFLFSEFAECLHMADELILTDIYAASEKPIEGVTTDALFQSIKQKRPKGLCYLKKEDIVPRLAAMVQKGDLVLFLGAGDVTHLSDELVRRLRSKGSAFSLDDIRVPGRESVRNFGVVGVIMGGVSCERDISLKSGNAVLKALGEAGCRVKPIDLVTEDRAQVKALLTEARIDVAFIALHGRFGEDGGIQVILDEMDIPYNGSGPAASYAGFNKCVSQRIFESKGILTPRTVIVDQGPQAFEAPEAVKRLGGFPLVVKPACEGSSIGVSLARDTRELKAAAARAFEYGQQIVIQECILGRELTVGILSGVPLPVVEIRAHSGGHLFFDFQAKYKDHTTQYIVPADLPPEVGLRVQAEALRAFDSLGCEGFARVDILLDAEGKPFILEVNTIPGFTSTSLLPKAARAAGLDFEQLCLTLIDISYGKKKTEPIASIR